MRTLSDLHELQRKVLQCLSTQDEISLGFIISSTPQLSARERLAIYSGSIMAAHIEVLQEAYPVCNRLVGSDFFKMMAAYFVQQNPSRQPTFNDYGKEFSFFIKQYPPAKSLCYLPDIARLEWAWHVAMYGEYNDTFEWTKLENFSTDRYNYMKFALPKDGTLLRSEYPIHHIWQVNQEQAVDKIISLDEGGVFLFIWRKQYVMHMDVLTEQEYLVLNAIASGKSLQELIDWAEQNNLSDNFINIMQQCMKYGWIIDCFDAEN